MAYYAYNAPDCGHCGKPMGLQEVNGGRQRLYCSTKCRKAAFRARKECQARQAMLTYNSELRDYWRDNGVDGQALAKLQDILLEHGKAAAKAATDAVLIALKDERYLQKGRVFTGRG
jgi:hypothetical protein